MGKKLDGSKIKWSENLSQEEKDAYNEEVRKRQQTLRMDDSTAIPLGITSIDDIRNAYKKRQEGK